MVKKSGTTGYVGASTAIAGINQWSLDYTVDALETSDFSASGVATYIPGKSTWSGTFSGYKDGVPLALAGASVDLHLAEAASVGNKWKGTAYITGVHPTVNFDGLDAYSYDFQGDGVLTVASTG